MNLNEAVSNVSGKGGAIGAVGMGDQKRDLEICFAGPSAKRFAGPLPRRAGGQHGTGPPDMRK